MLKEILSSIVQFADNIFDTVVNVLPPVTRDHIPHSPKHFLEKNPKLALENLEKAAKELLTRCYHA